MYDKMPKRTFNAFALSGRDYSNTREPRVSLRLPWASGSTGLSARPCKYKSAIS